MIRRNFMLTVFFFIASASCAFAASSVSPNISGSWSGSARGTSYHDADSTNPSSTPGSEPAQGNAIATFTQVGNDLSVTMTIISEESINLSFTGKAGDFVLWGTATRTDKDGNVDQVFISGKFPSKGNKISGKMVFYRTGHITIVSYTLKKNTSTALTRATLTANLDSGSAAPRGDGAPFSIAGKASGKSSDIASNAKAASYKVTVNGTVDPTPNTAIITFNESAPITFNVSNVDADKQVVLVGPGGSENVIMFGKSGETSASGTGYIYGGTRLVEFKFAVKQP